MVAAQEAYVSTLVRHLGRALVVGIMTLASLPASAQELSLGYQWQQFSFDIDDEFDVFIDDSVTAPLGFNVDVAAPITGALDVFGQVDWSRQSQNIDIFGQSVESSWTFLSYGGGVRWSSRASPSVTPFVQGLFGATRASVGCEVLTFDCDDFLDEDNLSSTNPMLQLGGGVAIPLGGLSALGQVDYRRVFVEDSGVNGFRCYSFTAGSASARASSTFPPRRLRARRDTPAGGHLKTV
jgi:hypothetical protein